MPDAIPPTPAYIAHPQALKRLDRNMILALAALFIFSMLVNIWGNRFPYFYHADEPGKVRQVLKSDRNFNHPLFMLEMAQGVAQVLHTPREPQAIVELGRWLSAFYLAITTLCITWLAWQWWNWWTALLTGWMFALAPDVIELSHFFKEDAALAMGIALFFVAALLWEARGHWHRLLLFGVVAGLCASTKYVGLAAIPLGMALIWWRSFNLRQHSPSGHWKRLGGELAAYFLAAVLAFGAVNYPMVTHRADAAKSFNRETELVLKGQGKMTKKTPHTGFIERFGSRLGLMIPFYLFGLWAFWAGCRQRKQWRTTWLFLAFPLILTLLLSFSAKDSGRYFLPAILGLSTTSAMGLVAVCLASRRRKGFIIIVSALAIIGIGTPLFRAYPYIRGFAQDARMELMAQLRDHTPPNAVLLQGDRIFLPAPDHRYADAWHVSAPREIRTSKFIADEAETPAQLRAKGITHVALNYSEYNRYIGDEQRPKEGSEDEFARRRAFYQRLFKEGKLLWESKEAKIGPSNPSLRLYELPLQENANSGG